MDDHTEPTGTATTHEIELDVRTIAKQDRHPQIFATYSELPVGGSLVLIADHDPIPLRREFDVDQPGSFDWEHLNREPRDWRIRITKRASTPLPRLMVTTHELADGPDASGVLWKVEARERDLDSNVIALAAGDTIDTHRGPDLDVMIHVLTGSGSLITECGTVELHPGALLWLPRRSQRAFAAGPQGLSYLTVHKRRQSLLLDTSILGR